MQRYNLFQTAHFTLQDALFEGARCLRKAGINAGDAADPLLALTGTMEQCTQLISAKEACVLPAVDAYEPALVDAVKQKHKAASIMANKLKTAFVAAMETTDLKLLYFRYMATQLNCMQKGEELLNPVLWYYYTDKELKEMELPLQAAIENLKDQ